MNLQVKINVNAPEDKDVVERLVNENLRNKLDNYLKKFEAKDDAEWMIEMKVEKNKKDRFNAILQVSLDRESYRYSREDYKNLDDVINHLFDHLKEELSSR